MKEYAHGQFFCQPGALPVLARIEPRLLCTAAEGGLLSGLVMFFLMAGYNASAGMGFLAILNVCFAAWVFRAPVPFFLSRLLFSAAVGGWAYWNLGYGRGLGLAGRQLGGAG